MPSTLSISGFFSSISDSDKVFLSPKDFDRFVPACCAMANGAGGWVVWGVSLKEGGALSDSAIPVVEGLTNPARLEKQLTEILRDASSKNTQNARLVSYFRIISEAAGDLGDGKKILAARVEPADWRSRPLRAGKSRYAYRRVEGENVVSGRNVRWRMALDALEVSRDDFSVPGLALADLDGDSVASFRDKLAAGFPNWSGLSMENFLKRALVLDEDGGVTRAGELLLGKNSNVLRVSNQDVPNLWTACEKFLPQISGGLKASCAAALRECFMNALLHAGHGEGVIEVELKDGAAFFSNPGLPRSLANGESEPRNYRLMRIFVNAGLASGEGRGLDIIREYDKNFHLSCNTLELATVAELRLLSETDSPVFSEPPEPGKPGAGESSQTEQADQTNQTDQAAFAPPGWMPVAREEFSRTRQTGASKILTALPKLYDDISEATEAAGSTETDEFDDEYLGTPDDDAEVFSPLIKQVRDTPRMPPDSVRYAILELCSEYKSLAELASTLARSEGSLRRHYVTAMVKEGLLEMEFPDRVGHPDQRYKVKG